ncbi:MAG: matrix protein [Wufeng shrew rhabdovirus 5]|nr:MAG: matrix protein [Wufeng shrew rhabdovirus 5]
MQNLLKFTKRRKAQRLSDPSIHERQNPNSLNNDGLWSNTVLDGFPLDKEIDLISIADSASTGQNPLKYPDLSDPTRPNAPPSPVIVYHRDRIYKVEVQLRLSRTIRRKYPKTVLKSVAITGLLTLDLPPYTLTALILSIEDEQCIVTNTSSNKGTIIITSTVSAELFPALTVLDLPRQSTTYLLPQQGGKHAVCNMTVRTSSMKYDTHVMPPVSALEQLWNARETLKPAGVEMVYEKGRLTYVLDIFSFSAPKLIQILSRPDAIPPPISETPHYPSIEYPSDEESIF